VNTSQAIPTPSLHAALDIGTSSIKCIVLDSQDPGQVHIIASASTPQRWNLQDVEVEPDQVLRVCLDMLRVLFDFAQKLNRPIVSLGLTGFVGSAFCIDRQGKPIGPTPIWSDQRCASQSEAHFKLPREQIRSIHGVDLPPGVCWPVSKISWLHENHPDVLASTLLVLQIKDYIFYKLTGLPYSEARTFIGLANVVESRFYPSVLEWAGVRPDQLPELHQAHETFEMLPSWRSSFPQYTLPFPRVGVGTADMTAAFLACLLQPGQAALLANTSEIIGLALPHENNEPTPTGVIRLPYQHNLDLIYGSTTNGAGTFHWFRDVFGEPDLDHLYDEAEAYLPAAEGLFFLPYLQGERAPIWDSQATGAFLGLRTSHTRAHMFRAVLEGTAFSKRHILETANPRKLPLRDLIVCGGTSRIPLWNKIRASVLNLPVQIDACPESSALGALFLAAESTCPKLRELYLAQRSRSVEQPVASWVQPYQHAYSRYVELSSSVRKLWRS
jgi:sugar (pentulose or hexulose) kinase